MILQTDESWISDIGDDFTVGVSIVFLQFLSDNSIIDVTIEHDREPVVKETVHPNIYLPPDKNETHFKTSSILRSFSQVKIFCNWPWPGRNKAREFSLFFHFKENSTKQERKGFKTYFEIQRLEFRKYTLLHCNLLQDWSLG